MTAKHKDIFSKLYSSLGLSDIKKKIDAVQLEIDKADKDYVSAMEEANGSLISAEIIEAYKARRRSLASQMTLLKSSYDEGRIIASKAMQKVMAEQKA